MSNIAQRAQFDKDKTALKYFLIGSNMSLALKALAYAERHHVGLRKDGKTVAFHHQVTIALTLITLKGLQNLERRIIAALLHDIQEDYGISREELEREFGKDVADDIWLLTKKFRGQHKEKANYINELSVSDVAIVKGEDRNYNLSAMINDVVEGQGGFTIEKLTAYAKEAETLFIPMLKKASHVFPEETHAHRSTMERLRELIRMAKYLKVMIERNELIKTHFDRRGRELKEAVTKTATLETLVNQQAKQLTIETRKREQAEAALLRVGAKLIEPAIASPTIAMGTATFVEVLKAVHKHGNIKLTTELTLAIANAMGLSQLAVEDYQPDQFSEGTST